MQKTVPPLILIIVIIVVHQIGTTPIPHDSDLDYMRAVRNRRREPDQDERVKDNWIQALKENILRQIGRTNLTLTNSTTTEQLPLTIFFNSTTATNDDGTTNPINLHITEKIRSYYPTCGVPLNTDQTLWNDNTIYMNLYFHFDSTSTIASATLRLYRYYSTEGDEIDQGLLRVSLYWYYFKKRLLKRRLADSKVVPTSALWVELNVKPAIKNWLEGQNSGLAVLVEDQDGGTLQADTIYRGPYCSTVTPRPIPTIIIDAAESNGTTTNSSVVPPPTLDICTIEFPQNFTTEHYHHLYKNACNLVHNRHIRHERHYDTTNGTTSINDGTSGPLNPDCRLKKKLIVTNDELQMIKRQSGTTGENQTNSIDR